MRSRRSVTIAPMAWPLRSLKFAIDFLARRIDGFWPGDRAELDRRAVEQLGVGDRLADAHVDHDLDQLRGLHRVGVLELLDQLGQHLLLVVLLEARGRDRA
jgi:hypothetical protein